GELDLHLFSEGTHYKIHEKLGAHLHSIDGVDGTLFTVWAPSALRVSVIGPFSNWDGRYYQMRSLGASGVWEIFIPSIKKMTLYKFEIKSIDGAIFTKTDPFGYAAELRPKTASVIWDQSDFKWTDQEWIEKRTRLNMLEEPLNIYELHLGSWARSENWIHWLSYRQLAPLIADYCNMIGYTHVELMPITEFPYDGSWGYQTTGYFAPTSRFGTPDDFKWFVNFLHSKNIGVIIDWTPAHFPKDAEGLRNFTGRALFEHEDPRLGENQEWGTLVFDYGRREVANFLISSALFWIEYYHMDGIRVDAVASMLYLDYSKKEGEWLPNKYGDNKNIEAIEFLKRLNILIHEKFEGAITIAEESTSFTGVSRPTYIGGLGFTFKWNMGWMHDMLDYFEKDPIHRKYHHGKLTFAMLYAFSENFILPISHDEVVHSKNALISKMPGDNWQKFANLRTFLAYMYSFPGKKLLFMGSDIGQFNEWNYDASLEWTLLDYEPHCKLQHFMKALSALYKNEEALWQLDSDPAGFEWIDCDDYQHSTISFIRRAKDPDNYIIGVFNMTPTPRENYRIGLSEKVYLDEILNSDSELFFGSNIGNSGGVYPDDISWHNRPYSISITLPPLAALFFKPNRKDKN
ncbi:MAG: 1,4-alpha-glucan branching protein GlgB, partial [Nitrospinota bacterium]